MTEYVVDPMHMFIGIEGIEDRHGNVLDSWEVPVEALDIHKAQKILNADADYWNDTINPTKTLYVAGEVRKAEIDEWIELAEISVIIGERI